MTITTRAKPLSLRCGVGLAVEFAGKTYPAWVERWSRRVFCAAGDVAKSASIRIEIPPGRFPRQVPGLWQKLHRWGYQRITIHDREANDG